MAQTVLSDCHNNAFLECCLLTLAKQGVFRELGAQFLCQFLCHTQARRKPLSGTACGCVAHGYRRASLFLRTVHTREGHLPHMTFHHADLQKTENSNRAWPVPADDISDRPSSGPCESTGQFGSDRLTTAPGFVSVRSFVHLGCRQLSGSQRSSCS